jgi:hypothetical protein
MEFQLRQRGRASMDFLVALTAGMRPVAGRWNAELAQAGVTAEALPDDIDERHATIKRALDGSNAWETSSLLMEFASTEHGRVAREAFEESRDLLDPALERLEQAGPATLHVDPVSRNRPISRTCGSTARPAAGTVIRSKASSTAN